MQSKSSTAGPGHRYGIMAKGLLRLKGNEKQEDRVRHFGTAGDLLTPHFLPQTCYKGLGWSTAFARHKKKQLVVTL